jgi:hypothetical protein
VPPITRPGRTACYVSSVTLGSLRGSALALAATVAAWSAGCATAPRPAIDPAFATGAYVPARIAVLPPDVFVVLDQVGDNDPVQSAALGQTVSVETVRALERSLRARGYDVDLSARWDGIFGADVGVLVSRDELGWLANGVLQFGNSGADGGDAGSTAPGVVAPELAAKVGRATQSDAFLYVNVKGVTTTNGKRAASILAGVFIVFVIAVIVLALAANGKGGGSSNAPGLGGGGFHGQPVARATPSGGGFRGVPPTGGHAAALPSGGFHGAPSSGAAAATPSGSAMARPSGGVAPGGGGWRAGSPPAAAPGGRVYGGGPNVGVGFGVGVIIPLDGPVYTHDGDVTHEDETFAGDELYVSMTLVSTYDGRILWHARQELDLDAEDPRDVDRMVQSLLDSLPPRGGFPPPSPAHK